MSRKSKLIEGQLHHVYVRGAFGNAIFVNPIDREYFIATMEIVNNTAPIPGKSPNMFERLRMYREEELPRAEPLVQIHYFTIVQNHVHIVFGVVQEGGGTKFIQRLLTSYSMRMQRDGHIGRVFGSTARNKKINSDSYRARIGAYVHLNVLDAVMPGWKLLSKEDRNVERMLQVLIHYPYSSAGDYCGSSRFENLLSINATYDIFGSKDWHKALLEMCFVDAVSRRQKLMQKRADLGDYVTDYLSDGNEGLQEEDCNRIAQVRDEAELRALDGVFEVFW